MLGTSQSKRNRPDPWLGSPHRLLAQLLYGTGMRITKAIGLRVKDVDFEHQALVVHEGKGAKDRVVMLPATA